MTTISSDWMILPSTNIKIVPESLMTLKSGVPNTTIIHYKYTSSINRKAEE